jgi:hypothetical protein
MAMQTDLFGNIWHETASAQIEVEKFIMVALMLNNKPRKKPGLFILLEKNDNLTSKEL